MSTVLDQLRRFEPKDGEWLPLDELLATLSPDNLRPEAIDALFTLLERFPLDDGAGVLWSVVHLLEAAGGYESRLLQSIATAPSGLAVTMINRMINGNITRVCDTELMEVLNAVAGDETALESVRLLASKFVTYQRKKDEHKGS